MMKETHNRPNLTYASRFVKSNSSAAVGNLKRLGDGCGALADWNFHTEASAAERRCRQRSKQKLKTEEQS